MRFLSVLLFVLALPLAASADESATASEAPVRSLPSATVESATRSEVQARIPVSGTIVARQEVQVFPQVSGYEITEILAEAGVEVILTPSCTDTVAGFNRVRIGAMARALESQCVVVHSPTVGSCDWNPAIDENRGIAAIYAPPDGLWPETGIVAEGAMDAPGWVKVEIDLDRIAKSRRDGRVLPFAHWPESEDVPVQS